MIHVTIVYKCGREEKASFAHEAAARQWQAWAKRETCGNCPSCIKQQAKN